MIVCRRVMVASAHLGNRGVPSQRFRRVWECLWAGRLVLLWVVLVPVGGGLCPSGLRWCLIGWGRAGVLVACLRA